MILYQYHKLQKSIGKSRFYFYYTNSYVNAEQHKHAWRYLKLGLNMDIEE